MLYNIVLVCHTSISHKYTHTPPSLELPSQPTAPTPSMLSQSTGLSSLCYTATSHSCDPLDCSLPGSSVHGIL